MNATSPFRWKPLLLVGLVAALLLWLTSITSLTHAVPQGGKAAARQPFFLFQLSPAILINQFTDSVIINWRSFSINVEELVRFLQPGAGSVALNHTLGADPSLTLGQLANGSIFFTNPNGLVSDPSAPGAMGPLLASTTLDISDAGFLTGRYIFRRLPGSFASIISQGAIVTAPGGFLALSALGEGTITAYLGTTHLPSGELLTLDFSGDGLIRFVVDRTGFGQTLGPVTLTVKAVNDLLSQMVNNRGITKAQSLASPPSWGTGSGALVIVANTTAGAESPSQNVANPPAPGASGGQININTAAGPIMAAARTDDSTAGAARTQAQPSSGQRLKVLGHGLVRFAVDATPVGSEGRTADMRARVVNTTGVTKATSLLSRGCVIQLVASEALALPLPAAPSRSY
jgi:filamentous hemagglutinin family protein